MIFLIVTFSVVDIFWLPRIFLYPGKCLALHFIHKTPMRIFKSYVNSYWQQVQEWEQDSNAVNKSRPHSQRPQLNWSKEDLWLNLSQRVSYQGFDTFNSGTVGISDSCCWCLVAKSCPTVCDPMDLSMPGFPVLHYLLEFSQTHVHWVSDVIQTSHPLSSPSPLAFNLSQNQGLFH